ncbi:MAG: DUF3306 domain-containing protein [Rhodospirillales bacterium]|nr:DUF3306 domain-containing protein [Rhodospirillales bacterium]
MKEEEGFLVRWSRRKQASRRSDRPDPPRPTVAATEERGVDTEPTIAPEELARLPRLEELTPDTDITGFLRPGVPEAIRNAALRKMWLLDPAIRDFPGHARDYAYDWNSPGGAPGSAPLEREEVAALLRRVLGGSGPADEHAAEERTLDPGDRGAGPKDEAETG